MCVDAETGGLRYGEENTKGGSIFVGDKRKYVHNTENGKFDSEAFEDDMSTFFADMVFSRFKKQDTFQT